MKFKVIIDKASMNVYNHRFFMPLTFSRDLHTRELTSLEIQCDITQSIVSMYNNCKIVFIGILGYYEKTVVIIRQQLNVYCDFDG